MQKGNSTRAVHAAMNPEVTTGSVQPPIFQTSTYEQQDFAVHKGFEYARTHNPTRSALETALAELESPNQPAHAICFASGMAAITAVSQLLKSGDHIVACDDLYGGTVRLFDQVLAKFDVQTTYSSLKDNSLEECGQENTKLLWLETPTNPLLSIHDISTLSQQAHDNGWLVVVDNTFASPMLQRPFDYGADIVIHSTTKYIGGHSDVIGGCAITQDAALAEKLRFLQNAAGAVPGPLDCFLTLRGIRTLAIRMNRHCENASELASRLSQHPKVTRMLYPGHETHPGYEIAAKQMSGFGGMISIEIEGGEEAARKFAAALRLFITAESLGGVESLINHPWTMTHASIPEEQRLAAGMTPGLVRLSVGIEDVEDLWIDIKNALENSS